MAIEPISEEAIFNVARKIESTEARDEYLNQVCGDDQAVYARVSTLLRLHDDERSFLESPPPGLEPTVTPEPFIEKPGSQIGAYKLREQIGEGGFGTVFVAQQERPVSRKVALKIIKPGMATKDVVARFEAERQALALMDHPNLAKVLDAGATDAGRPYFVMELVHGLPITEFCDDQKLSNRARLELFVDVCRAVQHAHQKGIIHRDLKPSNIMVTMHDDQAVPKIIDFGVAKALSQKLSENSIYTAYGQMVGTPLYMSPEQAQLSGLDVDTRSDVYSLGVLLYELLTGATPFDRETLKKAGVDELRRIIREDDPPIPSARVSTLNAGLLSTASDRRKIDQRKLSQSLRGELDWIVMKALDKNRARRYESASQLAEDIENFLEGEPVNACPPSLAYRIRKFSHRNRVALTTASLVAFALVLGTIVSVSQAVRASAAETTAGEQREAAVIVAEQARKSELAAQDERDIAIAAREKLRRVLYASEMNLLQVAWEDENYMRVASLLNETRPGPGETDLRGFEWHYWNRQLNGSSVSSSIQIPMLGESTLSADRSKLAFFRYADDVLTGGESFISIWDAKSAKEITRIELEPSPAPRTRLTFSPDGARLAFAGRPDKTLRIWDTRTGKELFRIAGEETIWGHYFSGDGNRVVYTYGTRDASPRGATELGYKVWDLAANRVIVSKEYDEEQSTRTLFLSPDGKRLGLSVRHKGEQGRRLRIWDTEKGEVLQDRLFKQGFAFCDVTPKRSQIVVQDSTASDQLLILDAQSLQTVSTLSDNQSRLTKRTAVSPDGRFLAASTFSNRVLVWNLQAIANSDASQSERHATSPLTLLVPQRSLQLGFDPDSQTLHTRGLSSTIRSFKLPTQWNANEPSPWLQGTILSGAFNSDGTQAILLAGPRTDLTGYDEPTTLIHWDVERDREIWRYKEPREARAFARPVISSDGKYIAVISGAMQTTRPILRLIKYDELILLDAESGDRVRVFRPIDAFSIDHVVFNPAGTHAAVLVTRQAEEASSRTFEVIVLDVATGEEVLASTIEDSQPGLCGFSHDGKELLVSRQSGGLLVLSASTGKQRRIIAPEGTQMRKWSLSPDGSTLAVFALFRTRAVDLYDAVTGERKSRIPSHYVPRSVHWSSDNRRLAVIGANASRFPARHTADISIWDTATGRFVLRLKREDSGVRRGAADQLRFRPDNHQLLHIAGDNRAVQESSDAPPMHPIRIWDATPLDESNTEAANADRR